MESEVKVSVNWLENDDGVQGGRIHMRYFWVLIDWKVTIS